MKKAIFTYFLILCSCASLGSKAETKDPAVVQQIDLNKYSGKWYEIARYPTFFQRNCIRATAEYQILDTTSVSVHNICYKENGDTSDIKGTATIVDPTTPAKLKVKFIFLAQGQYWVVALEPNYQWAVVSSSNKKSLFILSRVAPMPKETLDPILQDLKNRGFDLSDLVYDLY